MQNDNGQCHPSHRTRSGELCLSKNPSFAEQGFSSTAVSPETRTVSGIQQELSTYRWVDPVSLVAHVPGSALLRSQSWSKATLRFCLLLAAPLSQNCDLSEKNENRNREQVEYPLWASGTSDAKAVPASRTLAKRGNLWGRRSISNGSQEQKYSWASPGTRSKDQNAIRR